MTSGQAGLRIVRAALIACLLGGAGGAASGLAGDSPDPAAPAPSATPEVRATGAAPPFDTLRDWLAALLARFGEPAADVPVSTAPRALECDLGRSSLGSGPDYWDELPYSYVTPGQALAAALAEGFLVPVDGYRELEADASAVLYAFLARDEVKVAIRVVAVDEPSPGWRPERLATCRLAEFGGQADMGPGVWLWTNRHGRSMQERRLPARCGGPAGRVLIWRQPRAPEAPRSERYYVRDPEGFFRDDWQASYRRGAALPADATFTGYRRGGDALWMAADGRSLYVVRGAEVQRWPRVARITCA